MDRLTGDVETNAKNGSRKIRAAIMTDSHAAGSVTVHNPKSADSNVIINASPPHKEKRI